MEDGVCIRFWTRHTIPQQFAHLARLLDAGKVENTMFVAHVPEGMLGDLAYQTCNGDSGLEGWLREGELGFFRCNALKTLPHPDGDGVLIVGGWL